MKKSNDEIVEVMANAHLQSTDGYTTLSKRWRVLNSRALLSALRAEGYDLYRPDECETVCVRVEYTDWGMPYLCGFDAEEEVHHWQHGHTPEMARLVPVGGEG